ncbi:MULTISPECIES: UDP-N-acetylmuramate:L-alanyl-gamma-D-glutamyl-meso-diaminopimelate ligase [Acinetobacter]|jgi:UDP-N-acetylmuramate: L-alanyl-gamma-D-glutamyl-meso-diaminopimelate ligase|uniref:UDP-N-acetylmuramate--L-alanyl-gamma-D-glutamyl-meso-2,6-diaminoheptandioate ligase n=1 Tax=Acinetobacter radioresistens TaxID=40216 RepID=A0A8H2JWZ7_ACIRA|nr:MULTISPECIES: UDP-N-acetylmuramate:L-alanyl-gamma-D-glutamyl-meso-diaminopimelate ligase [Acinetobacter]ENV89948.1 UDP-N-acetylmuramate:L-alanyl-gamma-D-glutamyl-meso-diaminopimelate ligase [Acinetobacter radioresistens DSM 6976 = NBRC 102413 = CIP 103788]MCK4102862.1 UDP-N-acetylmuramate:L-alanyl-gamma-D-glutamyl-meso-diaminopimelate ligase [Acinetobacter radioresistens]MCM1935563.1 UDP-N-acetylmuramate:L-alanyl-gamma-D-glutamyl-meso-diaminopimelate ligase [Acinetobacter radioresistens]MCM1
MHLHILGICGTFMGSLALLARDLGHTVTGSDQSVYPPMSTQLENAGITLMQGYNRSHLQPHPDLVIVGNAMKRGIDAVEYMLDAGLPYISGPQFLADHVLQGKHVLGVAGTHGKTTTTTMLAWVLDQAGLNPGFLIGGVPLGFSQSARLGGGKYFVVEADEYDSAFFDKRSKFVHYHPKTAILNNLEFDHADIFDDLAAIQKQFHHLVRTIPSTGRIIAPITETHIDEVLKMGCWTPVIRTGLDTDTQAELYAELIQADGSHFKVLEQGKVIAEVQWSMTGQHSVANALATIAAAQHVGVSIVQACEALSSFGGVKRRMELLGTLRGIEVYDDFAHHPTAIETTLDGARKRLGERRLWAVIEPRSNTMRMGSHKDGLAHSARLADEVIWYQPEGLDWDLQPVVEAAPNKSQVSRSLDEIIQRIVQEAGEGDAVVIMSNGGFGGLHQKLLAALQS